MSEFDPIKAQLEILQGLQKQHNVVRRARDHLVAKLDEVELEAEAMISTEALLADMVRQAEGKLRQLREQAEQKATAERIG